MANIDKLKLSYSLPTGPDAVGFPGLTYPAPPREEPEPNSLYFNYNDNSSSMAAEYAEYKTANPIGYPEQDQVNPLDFLQYEEISSSWHTESCGPFMLSMGLSEAYGGGFGGFCSIFR